MTITNLANPMKWRMRITIVLADLVHHHTLPQLPLIPASLVMRHISVVLPCPRGCDPRFHLSLPPTSPCLLPRLPYRRLTPRKSHLRLHLRHRFRFSLRHLQKKQMTTKYLGLAHPRQCQLPRRPLFLPPQRAKKSIYDDLPCRSNHSRRHASHLQNLLLLPTIRLRPQHLYRRRPLPACRFREALCLMSACERAEKLQLRLRHDSVHSRPHLRLEVVLKAPGRAPHL